MTNSIGGKIRNFMVAILVGLLVVAFAVWGVNDVFTPNAGNAVIAVGDKEVSRQDFETQFSRELRVLARERGEGLSNQEAYNQGLHNQILSRMVTDTVISLDADELGIGVNRRDARDSVKEIEVFQNELTGEFSETKLNEILGQNQISRQQFERDTLRDLRRRQTVPSIIGGIEAPAQFAANYYNFITEQRKATLLEINEKSIDPITEPDDETIQTYIDANTSSFMAPEYRSVIMIRLEPSDFAEDLTITDEEIKDAFDYRVELGQIGSSETRDAVLITAPDEETALKAVEALLTGEDPSLVASGLGLVSPDIYTAVGPDGIFEPESAKAAFEVQEGEAKAILGSLGNWVAVYVPVVQAAVIPDFDAAKAELQTTLLREKAQDALYDITGQMEDLATEGKTLEEIALELDLPMAEYDYFDRLGDTQDGMPLAGFTGIPGIASDDAVLREIFTSDLGFETDLFETTTGGYVTLRVEDIIDSKLRPFEEIKEQAANFWKTEQINEALTQKSVALNTEIREGKTLEQVAEELGEGASLKQVGITRANPPQDIGSQVAVALLEASPGDVVRGLGAGPSLMNIARLDEIIPNADGLAGQFLDVIQERTTSAISTDIQNAYQGAILRDNPLREYPDQVKSALGIDTDN
ncbi:MAG: SurA N-terminal domain-containing protein [Litorimonas sp.]